MPYIYRVSRREVNRIQPVSRLTPPTAAEPAAEPVEVEPEPAEPSYRDLQAQAKALDIPANQTADDLKKALEEAEDG